MPLAEMRSHIRLGAADCIHKPETKLNGAWNQANLMISCID